MKIRSTKCCDLCKDTVAEKQLIFYRTTNDYVTVQMDEKPSLFSGDNTKRSYWHFCLPCWFGIMNAAKEAVKK